MDVKSTLKIVRARRICMHMPVLNHIHHSYRCLETNGCFPSYKNCLGHLHNKAPNQVFPRAMVKHIIEATCQR
jgi:hypothetical protein